MQTEFSLIYITLESAMATIFFLLCAGYQQQTGGLLDAHQMEKAASGKTCLAPLHNILPSKF